MKQDLLQLLIIKEAQIYHLFKIIVELILKYLMWERLIEGWGVVEIIVVLNKEIWSIELRMVSGIELKRQIDHH